MHFQFTYHNTLLDNEEVSALLSASKPDSETPFTIDLKKCINLKVLDPMSLFQQSVKSKNPALATLAAKLAINEAPPKTVRKPKSISKVLFSTPKENADTLIHNLVSSPSYKTVGAALLLLHGSSSEFKTLREVAVDFANEMYNSKTVFANSLLFKGFKLDKATGKLVPQEYASNIKRKETFHVSPLYLSLRGGMLLCKAANIIVTKSAYSIGSYRNPVDEKSKHLQRKYYTYSVLPRGEEIRDQWSDMHDFVINYFAQRAN